MDKPLLNNPDEFPTENVLSQVLNKSKKAWDEYFNYVSAKYPEIDFQWKYYKDGKSWLCKVTQKKKTICWISVWDKFFKIGFYFTEKNKKDIEAMNIGNSLQEIFKTSKSIGKLKPLVVEIQNQKLLANIYRLIEYKSKN